MGVVQESKADKVSSESALVVEKIQKELPNKNEGLRRSEGSMEDRVVRGSGRPNRVGDIEYKKERASIMEWEGTVQVYKKNNEEMDGIIREDRKGIGDQGKEELMTMEYPMSEKCRNEGDMVISSIVIGK